MFYHDVFSHFLNSITKYTAVIECSFGYSLWQCTIYENFEWWVDGLMDWWFVSEAKTVDSRFDEILKKKIFLQFISVVAVEAEKMAIQFVEEQNLTEQHNCGTKRLNITKRNERSLKCIRKKTHSWNDNRQCFQCVFVDLCIRVGSLLQLLYVFVFIFVSTDWHIDRQHCRPVVGISVKSTQMCIETNVYLCVCVFISVSRSIFFVLLISFLIWLCCSYTLNVNFQIKSYRCCHFNCIL